MPGLTPDQLTASLAWYRALRALDRARQVFVLSAGLDQVTRDQAWKTVWLLEVDERSHWARYQQTLETVPEWGV